MDRTSMAYWFPKIAEVGLPVPKTALVTMSDEEGADVWRLFDGLPPTKASEPFVDRIKAAADAFGYPCFLRTAHTSGKHDWDRTCYLTDPAKILGHVAAIIEYGEIQSMFGLPHDCWAVREYLPIMPVAVCPNYGGMPVCREFRVFVNDGDIECWHPYWPMEALELGGVDDPKAAFERLACRRQDKPEFMQEQVEFLGLASIAGRLVVDGGRLTCLRQGADGMSPTWRKQRSRSIGKAAHADGNHSLPSIHGD